MKKVILLAGPPATGKTYMSKVIKDKHIEAMYIAQDEVVELLYNKVGFNSEQEKFELIDYARTIFYSIVKRSLDENDVVMLDYPFSYKQMDFLNEIKELFDADFLTIRLVGDLDVLYDRRVERDLVATRNKGHIMNAYHGYESYTRETYPLSRDDYKRNCTIGKYDQFEFEETIEVDVTNYDSINYETLMNKVNDFLKKGI